MYQPRTYAAHLLRQHNRWTRTAWSLGFAAIGLVATLIVCWRLHPSLARVGYWGGLATCWVTGISITFASSIVAWLLQRESLLQSAQALDRQLRTKNRLETVALLHSDGSALARAQREETAGFLRRAPVSAHGGPLFALIAFVTLLVVSHLVTLVTWTRPWTRPEKKITTQLDTPPANHPKATIRWKTPEAQTKATALEEVPLEAVADSTSGLRNLVLEIGVDGETRVRTPISLDELKVPGPHKIQTSIYLDQLDVQPYDMISYHLHAQRIDPRKLPETVSPVQFVQVKPFRDDVHEIPGLDGRSVFPLITALKAAQLRLLKENFLLAYADLAHENATWKNENQRVGEEQGLLDHKTGEVIQKMIDEGAPAEIVNLLAQAKPLMTEVAAKIHATQNVPAVAPQGKALAAITEVEKFFIKTAVRDGGARGPTGVNDPFPDKKQFELKQRFKTQAGELELLAKEQARLADDLSKEDTGLPREPMPSDATNDPEKIDGTAAQRQAQISQRVGALLNGQSFVPDVASHLDQGREHARSALQQLDASDIAAAREPAASAARDLRLALDAMNRLAEQDAKDQLSIALRELNKAADEARSAPQQSSDQAGQKQAEKAQTMAAEAAQELAEAAQKQQETGSEKAAARMNSLAKALSSVEIKKALDRLLEQPRDTERAKDAANRLQEMADRIGQRSDPLSNDDLAHLIDRLQRVRTNMQRFVLKDQDFSQSPHVPDNQSRENSNTQDQASNKAANESRQGPQQGTNAEKDQGRRDQAGQGISQGAQRGETGQQGSGTLPTPPRDHAQENADSKADAGNSNPSKDRSGHGKGGYYDSGIAQNQPAGSSGSRTNIQSMRERFARDLIEDVDEALQEAARVLPQSDALAQVRHSARVYSTVNSGDLVGSISALDRPLEGVIKLLRAELHSAQRQHQLRDQSAESAPPAYRPAVADYFEQLSRDYERDSR